MSDARVSACMCACVRTQCMNAIVSLLWSIAGHEATVFDPSTAVCMIVI
jgi:hypothetical protein